MTVRQDDYRQDDNTPATASVTEDTAPAVPEYPWRVVCHRCAYVEVTLVDQNVAIAAAEAHLETVHAQNDPQAVIVPGDRRTFQDAQGDPMTGDNRTDEAAHVGPPEGATVEEQREWYDTHDVVTGELIDRTKQARDHREGTGTASFDLG